MKPTKHTPGPWTVSGHSTLNIIGKHTAKGRRVASSHEDTANAALISAAPDLLTKLIEFIDVLSNAEIDASGTNVNLDATLTEARALLNKATGGHRE